MPTGLVDQMPKFAMMRHRRKEQFDLLVSGSVLEGMDLPAGSAEFVDQILVLVLLVVVVGLREMKPIGLVDQMEK